MEQYRHGFCVEPACGVKFYRHTPTQRFCEKHSAQSKHLASWGKQTKCLMCEQTYVVKHGGQLYCGDQCKMASRNLRKKLRRQEARKRKPKTTAKCDCGAGFKPRVHGQKRCDNCIFKDKMHTFSAPPKPKDDGLPCLRCKHSKTNTAATFGFECTIGRWLTCKPLNPGAMPYEALDSTA